MKMKLDPIKKADILILRGLGYSTTEIAERLNISPQLVSYYLAKFKERADKVGPQWAFVEVLIQAGPMYPLFRIINKMGSMRGDRK